jgi:hypothetical protein
VRTVWELNVTLTSPRATKTVASNLGSGTTRQPGYAISLSRQVLSGRSSCANCAWTMVAAISSDALVSRLE